MRKMFYTVIIPGIILCFTGCADMAKSGNDEMPNIVLINIDDMGWRDVGFMGSEYYETPNIDAMASSGIVFTNAYAAASNCAPSRASMMTGQWTPRHGIFTVGSSERGKSRDRKLIPVENINLLADDQVTLPEVLKSAGYITCHAGKWHLGPDPRSQGFDINIGGCEAGNPGSYYPPYRSVPLDAPGDETYLTNYIMNLTLGMLDSISNKRFFLYYSPYAVHTPIQPVKELLPEYIDKPAWNGQHNPEYATMVSNLDLQVGRLYGFLEENNLLKNTLIIFTSDNGGLYPVTSQKPLRAGKGSYYEGGIREPLFIIWQNKIEAGRVSDQPVTSLDFFPTIMDIAGIDLPESKILDGESLLPILRSNMSLGERPLFWHFPIYLEGGNAETQDPLFRTRPGSALRLGDWKLIQYYENGVFELYNLADDPGEANNLAEEDVDRLNGMIEILERWKSDVNAPVPVDLNPRFIQEK